MNRIVFYAFLPDRINRIQRIFFFSQFPPARHRLRLQARRAGMKLRKGPGEIG